MNSIGASTKSVFFGGVALGAAAGAGLYELFRRYLSPNKEVQDRPFPYVPNYISPQAQEYLRTATPVGGPIESLEVWNMAREGFRGVTQDVSDQAKDKYTSSTKEVQIAGVPVLEVTPKNYVPPQAGEKENILIYIHGGAFTLGSPKHLYQIFAPVAYKAGGLKTYAIEYSLAPEQPFPKAFEECLNVYLKLQKQYGSEHTVLLGDSAGANLCIGITLQVRDSGSPMPAAIGLNSPLVDASGKVSDSFHTLAERSPKIAYEKSINPSMSVYADKETLKDPRISVIYADSFKGFPPTSIHTGTRDLLLSECARLDDRLKEAKVDSSLEVLDGVWHGIQEHGFPESEKSTSRMGDFFVARLKDKTSKL